MGQEKIGLFSFVFFSSFSRLPLNHLDSFSDAQSHPVRDDSSAHNMLAEREDFDFVELVHSILGKEGRKRKKRKKKQRTKAVLRSGQFRIFLLRFFSSFPSSFLLLRSMLRSALAALQSRKRAKKNSSSSGGSEKPLSAPSKFKLRLKKKGAIEVAGAAAVAPPPQMPSPPPSSPLPSASTLLLSLPMLLRARLSALAGSFSQVLFLAAQVASLFLTFYVAVVRMALDFPLSLASTLFRTAVANFLGSRPVAAVAAAADKATSAARARLSLPAKRLFSVLPAAKKKKKVKERPPGCVFYECALHHRRLRPARHEFEYRVRMAFLDLDAPPRWFSSSSSSSKARGAHLSAAEARKAAGLLPSSKGPVWLLTMPPAAGYSQNPISVYYCYAEGEEKNKATTNDGDKNLDANGNFAMPPASNPVAAIAEVTNTPWGSVARFSFDPSGDSVPKCLHVSPFMDMRNEWRLTAPAPGQRLALSVAALHPELGAFFTAALVGKVDSRERTRSCLAERSGDLITFWNYAYGPQRVALWIYGHAAVLFWRKGLPVIGPPELGAGAKAVEENGNGKRRRTGNSSSSLSSSSSHSFSSLSNSNRWHEWVAAKEWPWRFGACGI